MINLYNGITHTQAISQFKEIHVAKTVTFLMKKKITYFILQKTFSFFIILFRIFILIKNELSY
jgi:hypothetical protein